MEILSPIKSIENAKIAIKKGADALYLASPNFGARVNASMNKEEIEKIIKLAKSYNVKTFITFNVVIFNNEINKFLKEIDDIYIYGATGIIIQDFSFISLIKKRYPDLEVHASTQMNIHNKNSVNIIKKLGVNQVVVPREMSFNKIHKLKESTNIKIEAFTHGALCVCYSGQCYDSTLLDQKSANRGRCSQYCRMPSKVFNTRTQKYISENEYSLNIKDLNTLDILDDYKKSGVDVLKIEGRLKGIDYVGLTTESYKRTVDNFEIKNDLREVYNREFTKGLINKQSSEELLNGVRPNNNGIKIGVVKESKKNDNKALKFYNYKIILDLNKKIYKGDNLRFLESEEKGQVVEKFEDEKGIVTLYSKFKISPKTEIFRTKNNKLIKEYEEEIKFVDYKRSIINTSIKITKKSIEIQLENKYNVDIEVFKAQKHDLKKENVIEILKKTKNTDYDINIKNLEIEEGIFLPNKHLKIIRDEIISNHKKEKETRKSNHKNVIIDTKNKTTQKENTFYFSIKELNQLEYFLKKKQEVKIKIMVFYSLVERLKELNKLYLIEELKEKYQVYLVLPRVLYDDKEEEIKEIIKLFDSICISELGSIKYKELIKGDIISNFSLNTTNTINQKFLSESGVKKQIISIELNEEKIKDFDNEESIINIYGSIPVMIMDYCPINPKKANGCGTCKRCRSNNYQIKDNLNRTFPLRYEGDNKIGLYSEKKLSLFEELKKMKCFSNFNINLLDESDKEIELILNSIKDNKTYIKDTFKGNYYKEVL